MKESKNNHIACYLDFSGIKSNSEKEKNIHPVKVLAAFSYVGILYFGNELSLATSCQDQQESNGDVPLMSLVFIN